jgi:hypothetical protein
VQALETDTVSFFLGQFKTWWFILAHPVRVAFRWLYEGASLDSYVFELCKSFATATACGLCAILKRLAYQL